MKKNAIVVQKPYAGAYDFQKKTLYFLCGGMGVRGVASREVGEMMKILRRID